VLLLRLGTTQLNAKSLLSDVSFIICGMICWKLSEIFIFRSSTSRDVYREHAHKEGGRWVSFLVNLDASSGCVATILVAEHFVQAIAYLYPPLWQCSNVLKNELDDVCLPKLWHENLLKNFQMWCAKHSLLNERKGPYTMPCVTPHLTLAFRFELSSKQMTCGIQGLI